MTDYLLLCRNPYWVTHILAKLPICIGDDAGADAWLIDTWITPHLRTLESGIAVVVICRRLCGNCSGVIPACCLPLTVFKRVTEYIWSSLSPFAVAAITVAICECSAVAGCASFAVIAIEYRRITLSLWALFAKFILCPYWRHARQDRCILAVFRVVSAIPAVAPAACI